MGRNDLEAIYQPAMGQLVAVFPSNPEWVWFTGYTRMPEGAGTLGHVHMSWDAEDTNCRFPVDILNEIAKMLPVGAICHILTIMPETMQ